MFFLLRPLSSLRYCSNCSSMNRTTGSQLACGEKMYSLRSQGRGQNEASQACWVESNFFNSNQSHQGQLARAWD